MLADFPLRNETFSQRLESRHRIGVADLDRVMMEQFQVNTMSSWDDRSAPKRPSFDVCAYDPASASPPEYPLNWTTELTNHAVRSLPWEQETYTTFRL